MTHRLPPQQASLDSLISRRFGPHSAQEWQLLVRHLEFSVENQFGLIWILVPDTAGAEVCAASINTILNLNGKNLSRILLQQPADLHELSAHLLLDSQPSADTGALWISAVFQESHPAYKDWALAWRNALARLNERRASLARRWPMPIFFNGAPWLKSTSRKISPDLWSVRSLVLELPADADLLHDNSSAVREPSPADTTQHEWMDKVANETEVALYEAAWLRAHPGNEEVLSKVLTHLASRFMSRAELAEAERALSEAEQVLHHIQMEAPSTAESSVLIQQAWLAALSGQPEMAINCVRKGIEKLSGRSSGFDLLVNGRLCWAQAALNMNNLVEAAECIEVAKRCLIDPEVQPLSLSQLPSVLLTAQLCDRVGDLAGREHLLRTAISVSRRSQVTPVQIGSTVCDLVVTLFQQEKRDEAEQLFLEAQNLYAESGSQIARSRLAQKIAEINNGQGRYQEVEAWYRRAVVLAKDAPATSTVLGTLTSELGNSLCTLRRFEEAEEYLGEALQHYRQTNNYVRYAQIVRSIISIHILQNQYQKARNLANDAIALLSQVNPKISVPVHLALADALYADSRYKEAEREYRIAEQVSLHEDAEACSYCSPLLRDARIGLLAISAHKNDYSAASDKTIDSLRIFIDDPLAKELWDEFVQHFRSNNFDNLVTKLQDLPNDNHSTNLRDNVIPMLLIFCEYQRKRWIQTERYCRQTLAQDGLEEELAAPGKKAASSTMKIVAMVFLTDVLFRQFRYREAKIFRAKAAQSLPELRRSHPQGFQLAGLLSAHLDRCLADAAKSGARIPPRKVRRTRAIKA